MGEGTLSDGEAVEEGGCWSGKDTRPQIFPWPDIPQTQISPGPRYSLRNHWKGDSNPVYQVAVLAAYSLLSYLSLSAHNAWMRENTVSQTYQTLKTRLLIVAERKHSASVETAPNPKKVRVDAAACIWERIESP